MGDIMMRVLVAVSFFFALSLTIPTSSPFDDLTDSPFNAPEQPFCPASWMVTVAIRNVPKLDKDSGSDVFFKLKNPRGKTVKESETKRNIKTGEEVQFAQFKVEVPEAGDYVLKFTDKDTGFMNTDDKMTKWSFDMNSVVDGEWHDVWNKDSGFKHNTAMPFEVQITKISELEFLRSKVQELENQLAAAGESNSFDDDWSPHPIFS